MCYGLWSLPFGGVAELLGLVFDAAFGVLVGVAVVVVVGGSRFCGSELHGCTDFDIEVHGPGCRGLMWG